LSEQQQIVMGGVDTNSDVRKLRIYVAGNRASVPQSEATGPGHFQSFCSYIIKSDPENVVSLGTRRLGSISTTKTAQYQGLIFGMRACAKLGDAHPTELEFVSDFSMCVNHMNATCDDSRWKVFYHIAKGLEAHLKNLSWVRAITFSHAARGDVDIAAAHRLAKKKAGQKVDLYNFNSDALTYYPDLCSMSIIRVVAADGDSWGSPFAGSFSAISTLAQDQAIYIDATCLAFLRGFKALETLEDPGPLSWIDARGGSLEVLGLFKGAVKLKVNLIAGRDGSDETSVVNISRFVVVHNLPVPLHVHVADDDGHEWKGGEYGPEKLTPKFPLMANFRKFPKKYQEHPFWHVNPNVIWRPAYKKRFLKEHPEYTIVPGQMTTGQPHHFHSVEHDEY